MVINMIKINKTDIKQDDVFDAIPKFNEQYSNYKDRVVKKIKNYEVDYKKVR